MSDRVAETADSRSQIYKRLAAMWDTILMIVAVSIAVASIAVGTIAVVGAASVSSRVGNELSTAQTNAGNVSTSLNAISNMRSSVRDLITTVTAHPTWTRSDNGGLKFQPENTDARWALQPFEPGYGPRFYMEQPTYAARFAIYSQFNTDAPALLFVHPNFESPHRMFKAIENIPDA
jgi:hypothetical protein